jgi:hypothetical protein
MLLLQNITDLQETRRETAIPQLYGKLEHTHIYGETNSQMQRPNLQLLTMTPYPANKLYGWISGP